MKTTKLALISRFALATLAGCSSGTEYEVTGEVSSASTIAGKVTLVFYEELTPEGDEVAERSSVLESELDALGNFTETVEVSEGATIIAFALADEDGDGACTAGELWAEVSITPKDDGSIDPVTLNLTAAACP